MVHNDGLDEYDASAYGDYILPFPSNIYERYLEEKINFKTPEGNDAYLNIEIINPDLNELHVHFEGTYDKRAYHIELQAQVVRLENPFSELSADEQYNLHQGNKTRRTWVVEKYQ